MGIEYFSPSHIIFGSGEVDKLFQVVERFGKFCLLVLGKKSMFSLGIVDKIKNNFYKLGIKTFIFSQIPPEPTYDYVDKGIKLARENNCDFVLGIGGGSVLDVAKAIAGLINEKFSSVREFMYGREITKKGIPFIAIPTTSGTGTEVSKNSVLRDDEEKIKCSIRNPSFLAKVALIDPKLTISLSPKYTAYSGMDALTHAIESYVSLNSNLMTEVYSLKAVKLIFENILIVYQNGNNLTARENMSMASLLAGLSFSNAGLGLCHGIAHPIGAIHNLAHGLVNAILLPYIVEFNMKSAEDKYKNISKFIPGSKKQSKKLVDFLFFLNRKLGIPNKLSELSIKIDQQEKEKICDSLKYSFSAKLNPKRAEKEDIINILSQVC